MMDKRELALTERWKIPEGAPEPRTPEVAQGLMSTLGQTYHQ